MSSSKKKSTLPHAADAADAAVARAGAYPIPTGIPAPPAKWVDRGRVGKKGRRPTKGLTQTARQLAKELRKNAARLAHELGPKGVDPEQLADALDLAQEWVKVEEQTSALHLYARSQRGSSWDAAMKLMGGMMLGVRFAVSRDATFADRFPAVTKAFSPRKRRRKKKQAPPE